MLFSSKFKIFLPIILLMIAEILIITEISSVLTKNNLHNDAVKYGTQTIKQYQEIRSYYNKNVVQKVTQQTTLNVDAQHKGRPDTIPLPATMIHDISEQLSQSIDGMKIKLYSDYPFPNRAERVLDDFEKSSIEHFRNTQQREPVILREQQEGVEVIRVAVADEMNALSCVNCHNSRADTPKSDWQLGDVRGVLEVTIPIQSQLEGAHTVTMYINLTLIAAGIILLLLSYFVLSHFANIEKRQQEKLKEEQYKLNKSVISFGQNVIASNTDLHGFITYASQAFCDISGYTEEELLGKSHNIIRHPDMPKETFKEMWQTVKSGKTWQGEIKNRKKNGGFYWVRTTVFPDYDFNNTLIGYGSIRHDITAQKAKEQFFSNMSHELRTPLNAIIGFVGILNRQIDDRKHKKYLGHIESSSQQLLTLINDILDLSKIQHGDFTIEPHEFHAYTEMTEYARRFEGILSSEDINFSITIDQNLQGTFLGDWLRISQIILNLVSNAIKFTPHGGSITLYVEYRNGTLVITVADTGIGMNPDIQDKVFKPFVQADGSTTRKYGGTGLGLSITHKLIELMNGKLELQSEENKGSTFTVFIPLEKLSDDTDVDENNVDDKKIKTALKGNILVAEDNTTNQILIKLLLEEFGLTCDIANDGLEALEMYDPAVHRLVLMDENMPNMNGIIAMHRIREKHGNSCGPIIALTANVMEGDKERFLQEGMDAYLGKPIDEDALYELLKEFLKQP